MKICFLAGTLGPGGAERQLLFMSKAARDAGADVRVLTLRTGEFYEDSLRKSGIEVDWVGPSKGRVNRLATITKDLFRRPADIIQSGHFFTNIYAAAAGRIAKAKSIGAIRSNLILEAENNKYFRHAQLRMPHHLIANSQIAIDRAISAGVAPACIDLVKNVVETPHAEHGGLAGRTATNIIFVGRLTAEKRPEIFIDLAERLVKALPNAALNFDLAGDGPLRSALEDDVKARRGLSGCFSFLGNRPDVANVYRSADLLILTSQHEGTPNVVLEAMAHSIPVVATRVGGVADVLREDAGFVSDPGDIDGLFRGAERLITDRPLREQMGRAGRRFVTENHSPAMLEASLMRVYDKVVTGRNRG